MPRIIKDYKSRRRTPINIAPSHSMDEAKMSGKAAGGSHQSNREQIIAHEKAMNDRNKRKGVPNSKLGKQR
jgi:hypothetical protein